MSEPLALIVPAERRELLARALADAVFYRDPPVECFTCDNRWDGLCNECKAGLAQGHAYLALAEELDLKLPA